MSRTCCSVTEVEQNYYVLICIVNGDPQKNDVDLTACINEHLNLKKKTAQNFLK